MALSLSLRLVVALYRFRRPFVWSRFFRAVSGRFQGFRFWAWFSRHGAVMVSGVVLPLAAFPASVRHASVIVLSFLPVVARYDLGRVFVRLHPFRVSLGLSACHVAVVFGISPGVMWLSFSFLGVRSGCRWLL